MSEGFRRDYDPVSEGWVRPSQRDLDEQLREEAAHVVSSTGAPEPEAPEGAVPEEPEVASEPAPAEEPVPVEEAPSQDVPSTADAVLEEDAAGAPLEEERETAGKAKKKKGKKGKKGKVTASKGKKPKKGKKKKKKK